MVLEPQNEVHLQEVGQIAFTVRNLAEAKSFYRDVLGLKFLFEAGTMAFFQCGSVRLMIGEAEKPSISEGTIVYFRVADLEDTAHLLESRGTSFVQSATFSGEDEESRPLDGIFQRSGRKHAWTHE